VVPNVFSELLLPGCLDLSIWQNQLVVFVSFLFTSLHQRQLIPQV